MSAGASKELSSFFLFGKNLRLVGASVKDCVLLYKRTEGEVMVMMLVVMVIRVGSGAMIGYSPAVLATDRGTEK